MARKALRTCADGHRFYKSSACPTCPQCAAAQKPTDGLLSLVAAPARRALQSLGVHSAKDLARHTEAEIAALHGMGPSALAVLKKALTQHELRFRK